MDKVAIQLRRGGRITVTQSVLGVEFARVVHDSPGCVAVRFGTEAKYPDVAAFGGGRLVSFGTGPATLHKIKHASEFTDVRLTGRRGKWSAAADPGKYGVLVVFVRERKRGRMAVFDSEDSNG